MQAEGMARSNSNNNNEDDQRFNDDDDDGSVVDDEPYFYHDDLLPPSQSSMDIAMALDVVLSVDLYDLQTASWEPLLDSTGLQISRSAGTSKTSITFPKPTKLRLSHNHIESLCAHISTIWGGSQATSLATHGGFHPFRIVNETGQQLSCFAVNARSHPIVSVAAASSRPIPLRNARREVRKGSGSGGPLWLVLAVEGGWNAAPIRIDRMGTSLVKLQSMGGYSDVSSLCVEVRPVHGCREVLVRSHTTVASRATVALEVLIAYEWHGSKMELIHPLSSHASLNIPASAISNGSLQFRPAAAGHQWSSPVAIVFFDGDRDPLEMHCAPNPGSNKPEFYFILAVTGESYRVVTVSPCLLIHNALPAPLLFQALGQDGVTVVCDGRLAPDSDLGLHSKQSATSLSLSLDLAGLGWSAPQDIDEKAFKEYALVKIPAVSLSSSSSSSSMFAEDSKKSGGATTATTATTATATAAATNAAVVTEEDTTTAEKGPKFSGCCVRLYRGGDQQIYDDEDAAEFDEATRFSYSRYSAGGSSSNNNSKGKSIGKTFVVSTDMLVIDHTRLGLEVALEREKILAAAVVRNVEHDSSSRSETDQVEAEAVNFPFPPAPVPIAMGCNRRQILDCLRGQVFIYTGSDLEDEAEEQNRGAEMLQIRHGTARWCELVSLPSRGGRGITQILLPQKVQPSEDSDESSVPIPAVPVVISRNRKATAASILASLSSIATRSYHHPLQQQQMQHHHHHSQLSSIVPPQIIEIAPLLVICNELRRSLRVRQVDADKTHPIIMRPGTAMPLYWTDHKLPWKIQLSFLDEADEDQDEANLARKSSVLYGWSCALSLDLSGVQHTKIPFESMKKGDNIIKIDCNAEGATMVARMSLEASSSSPYILQNDTHFDLAVWQNLPHNMKPQREIVAARSQQGYMWDDGSYRHSLCVEGVGATGNQIVSLDRIGKHRQFTIRSSAFCLSPSMETYYQHHHYYPSHQLQYLTSMGSNAADAVSCISVEVSAIGNSRLVVFSINNNARDDAQWDHYSDTYSANSPVSEAVMAITPTPAEADASSSAYRLHFDSISLGLSDSKGAEILVATLCDIRAEFSSTISDSRKRMSGSYKGMSKAQLSIQSLQVDNMSQDTPFPVAVATPEASTDDDGGSDGDDSSSSNSSKKKKKKNGDGEGTGHRAPVLCIDVVFGRRTTRGKTPLLCFPVIDIKLQPLFFRVDSLFLIELGLFVTSLPPNPFPPPPTPPEAYDFGHFQLQPVTVFLSFAQRMGSKRQVQAMANALGLAPLLRLPHLDRSPIHFPAFDAKNHLMDISGLFRLIADHYFRAAAAQALKIAGSAEFLGNPVGLLLNLGEGMQALVYQPVKGLAEGPEHFLKGLVTGTSTFVQQGVAGIHSSTNALSSTVARRLALMSMDDNYLKERDALAVTEQAPVGAISGVRLGLSKFGRSVGLGFSDLVHAPVSGFRNHGWSGLAQGLSLGVLGAAVKPAVGAMDMISTVTAGVCNSVSPMHGSLPNKRLRGRQPPRRTADIDSCTADVFPAQGVVEVVALSPTDQLVVSWYRVLVLYYTSVDGKVVRIPWDVAWSNVYSFGLTSSNDGVKLVIAKSLSERSNQQQQQQQQQPQLQQLREVIVKCPAGKNQALEIQKILRKWHTRVTQLSP